MMAKKGVLIASVYFFVQESYSVHLEPYHGWLLKNAFRMGLNGLPYREDLFRRLVRA